MPELPEVETTVKGLQQKVLNRTFIDVWTDWEKMAHLRSNVEASVWQVNRPGSFEVFKKELLGKKITKVWRRGKNVIFDLSDGYSLLVHMKMTGHLMVGFWDLNSNGWQPRQKGPFEEKINGYLHIMWTLDNGLMIALSDLRKFAKVELWKTQELLDSPGFKNMGPEPLELSFTFAKFKEALAGQKGKIKHVLMVPEVIVGIGNIYSSEALWWAKIHPEKSTVKLSEAELKELYKAVKKVLGLGIELGGESFADYRNVDGQKGHFYQERKVYKKEKELCARCKTPIKRLKVGGRSAFFCPECQKLL
jgi:formamidopyrimidine-DNA glycosylase